jgi:hypothetical protein
MNDIYEERCIEKLEIKLNFIAQLVLIGNTVHSKKKINALSRKYGKHWVESDLRIDISIIFYFDQALLCSNLGL